MNKAQESLSLLSIFHYIIGGMVAFYSLFPLTYWNLFGATWFLLGETLAISTIISGRWLRKYKGYWFSLSIAFLLCIYLPLGTVLGILTIVVLSRQSVKQLYLSKKEKGQFKREFQRRYDLEYHQFFNLVGDLNPRSTK